MTVPPRFMIPMTIDGALGRRVTSTARTTRLTAEQPQRILLLIQNKNDALRHAGSRPCLRIAHSICSRIDASESRSHSCSRIRLKKYIAPASRQLALYWREGELEIAMMTGALSRD